MSDYIYTVEVPLIMKLMMGVETQQFQNQDPFIARNQALQYLSQILVKAVEKDIIKIFDFEDEHTTKIKQLKHEDLPLSESDKSILDFKKIMEYKIVYYTNDIIETENTHQRKIKGLMFPKKIGVLGFLNIRLTHEIMIRQEIFELKNYPFDSYFSYEENMLSDYLEKNKLNYKDYELVSDVQFEKLAKIRDLKTLFYDQDYRKKDNLKTENYFEIEKIYLSLINTPREKYLFHHSENQLETSKILHHFHDIYLPKSRFEFIMLLDIKGEKYQVFVHKTNYGETKTYSKQGKLYVRNNSGAIEIDENSSIFEVIPEQMTKNKELQNVLNILNT